MIQKWYRGHEGSKHALDNFGIIWLTDDPEYAQVYADEYPDGIVSTVYVDKDKVNDADVWTMDYFEPYFPDEEDLEEIKSEGYNGYYFMAGYDGYDYQCLALLSKEPIIKVENKIVENMKLTYNDIRYIMHESTKRILSEIYKPNTMKEDFSIDIFEVDIDPEFEDELETYEGPDEFHVICSFDCFEGQKGSYEQEPISPYCTLREVLPGNNEEMKNRLSPELFTAIMNGVTEYVWNHSEEFEEEACMSNEPDPMDYFDEDEYRYKKLGY